LRVTKYGPDGSIFARSLEEKLQYSIFDVLVRLVSLIHFQQPKKLRVLV
jgi:hypothetical protein